MTKVVQRYTEISEMTSIRKCIEMQLFSNFQGSSIKIDRELERRRQNSACTRLFRGITPTLTCNCLRSVKNMSTCYIQRVFHRQCERETSKNSVYSDAELSIKSCKRTSQNYLRTCHPHSLLILFYQDEFSLSAALCPPQKSTIKTSIRGYPNLIKSIFQIGNSIHRI